MPGLVHDIILTPYLRDLEPQEDFLTPRPEVRWAFQPASEWGRAILGGVAVGTWDEGVLHTASETDAGVVMGAIPEEARVHL